MKKMLVLALQWALALVGGALAALLSIVIWMFVIVTWMFTTGFGMWAVRRQQRGGER